MACPDGTFIHEPCYEGYGEFNGQDVYELVVRWNRAFIAENPDFLLPHIHRFYNGSVKQYRLKDFRWYPVIADLSIPFEQLRDALDKHLREPVSLHRPYSAELRGVRARHCLLQRGQRSSSVSHQDYPEDAGRPL